MDLFAARHGETISNIEKRITRGEGDSPLSRNGVEQAKVLGML